MTRSHASNTAPRIAVIGAGIAGMAAAIRLRLQGNHVEVFEAGATAGGKLGELVLGEYRFGIGPSLLTMPEYIDELFALAGEMPSEHFRYQRLDTVCRYAWEDGTRLDARADPQAFAHEVEQVLGVPAQRVLKTLAHGEEKYRLTGHTFLEKSLHSSDTWLTPEVGHALTRLHRLDLTRTLHQVHQRDLKEPHLVQLFDRFATYNGSNPYRAPGLLSMIAHFEHGAGAFVPEGGMPAIGRALFDLAERVGVIFHFNTAVAEILTHRDGRRPRAVGLRLQDEREVLLDRVVSNMDVFFTHQRLLPDAPAPTRVLAREKSTSALIFYWGVDRSFPELDVHNIFFSDDYAGEFEALEAGTLCDDPTIYVSISSRYDPSAAPEGGENWFVMINAPFATPEQDWPTLIERTRERVIDKLERMLGSEGSPAGLREAIVEECVFDPTTIEARTLSHLGALYGTSSNDRMAAFMRHPNYSRHIDGLYFCGGSVHPGGGLPLCLLSARIMTDVMARREPWPTHAPSSHNALSSQKDDA
ncbi:1-hydroxycarotenoid 3,4-desaturase CrtD [Kushneria indalinina]|uniref:Phytoene desaturase n=1 Tax=Kushneria indalinina DSM 14324 TaxID=1122140 RepID=A0A3D9DVY3_9GAMM|nr:1-hydroxycarotenoid 3,4-desaturase CrtD [Kushneria indalinina]REC94943.1 phytoene desaturase [Kushneria indalinina DSM 14324]